MANAFVCSGRYRRIVHPAKRDSNRNSKALGGMKLQFSLATLLVCVTVLAVVCGLAVAIPVHDPKLVQEPGSIQGSDGYLHTVLLTHFVKRHTATASDVIWRCFVWGPASLAMTVSALWLIRRLKSRRHTEPPVG